MAFFKTMTQGGQVHLHQLRMLKQVFCAGCIVAILIGVGYFTWKCLNLPNYAWRMAYETYWAKFMLVSNPEQTHKRLTQIYMPYKGSPYQRPCVNVLSDPLLQKVTAKVERYVSIVGKKSLMLMLWSFCAVMGFWFVFGLAQKRTHHKRGTTLVSWKELKKLIRRNREASYLKLKLKFWRKLPLLKNKETSHILITGTTGSGKTNAFHSLLPQIRKGNHPAIIVDITGDYVARYYNPETDIILNPLDARSKNWHPWVDCHSDSHYDVLAESFIQSKDRQKDPFWDNASRVILKTALRKYAKQSDFDIEKLVNFLLSSTDYEFENFFKGTDAITFAFKNNDKTTASIRSVLSSQIEGLRQLSTPLEGESVFSVRSWVSGMSEPSKNPSATEEKAAIAGIVTTKQQTEEHGKTNIPKKQGWLFLTARADQRQTLVPLISAWVDIAINALMVLPPDQKRRLWFIMDELASLQKLPRLQMGLAEARKYGGCFLAGFQSRPQLEEVYGRSAADSMLDLFNTKLFFRCTEPSTQLWISKVLGDREETSPQENISFGANSMRDGVSLSRQTRQTPLIMPTQLSQLRDLNCYLKLPGDYPCVKLQMKYQKAPFLAKPAFLLKPEKERKLTITPESHSVVQTQPIPSLHSSVQKDNYKAQNTQHIRREVE